MPLDLRKDGVTQTEMSLFKLYDAGEHVDLLDDSHLFFTAPRFRLVASNRSKKVSTYQKEVKERGKSSFWRLTRGFLNKCQKDLAFVKEAHGQEPKHQEDAELK